MIEDGLFSKTFKMNSILKSEISLLKIENRATLFQDWLNFHSLQWNSTSKKLESTTPANYNTCVNLLNEYD